MSDKFWKRLSIAIGFIALATIIGLAVFMANVEIKDLDIWLHIGMGRYILSHNFQVPDVDILSHSIAGKPWVNHEWLFQVIVFTLYNNFGPDGLIGMQVILVALTLMILLFLGYNRQRQFGTVFMLLLVSLVYQSRLTTRPDLFSLLFFVLYIFILAFFIHRRWSILSLFVLQVLWTNIHGFFFFGPVFVAIGLLAEWMRRHLKLPYEWNRTGKLTDREYGNLKWGFLAVCLACLFNPLTFKGAWYPFGVMLQISGKSGIFFNYIQELQKPITWKTLFSMDPYPYYRLLILLSASSFIFNRRKIDIGVLVFWIVFLFFSLSAIRNMIFFAFAAYLAFITNILTVSARDVIPIKITDKKFVSMTSILLKIFIIFWTIEAGMKMVTNGYFDFDTFERKSEFGGVSQRNYPVKAVKFLKENSIQGDFFNDFNTGAYLIGQCYPDIKVFIDGRTEVYGPDFFEKYRKIWRQNSCEESFEEMLNDYPVTGILLPSHHHQIPKCTMNVIKKKKEWIPVYCDYDGMIWLKDVAKNSRAIKEHRIDFSNWQVEKLDVLKLGSKRIAPYHHINRAYTLEDLGYDAAALAEAKEALRITPNLADAYKIIGKIHARKREFLKAFENFRYASLFDPNDKKVKKNMALAYYDMGELDYAAYQYEKMISQWPTDPEPCFLLARVYLKLKRYKDAVDMIQKGYDLDPSVYTDVLDLGDMLFADKVYVGAQEVYKMLLTKKDRTDKVYEKLGLLYFEIKEWDLAKESFEKGLELNSENEVIKEKLKELEKLKESDTRVGE